MNTQGWTSTGRDCNNHVAKYREKMSIGRWHKTMSGAHMTLDKSGLFVGLI